ncbi:hypothetical protein EMIT043CA1_210010 [Pseudomonas brassicacearum]
MDLSLRGHPRKAAHFIPQQGRKRNTDSEILCGEWNVGARLARDEGYAVLQKSSRLLREQALLPLAPLATEFGLGSSLR